MWVLDTGILVRYVVLSDPLCPLVRHAVRVLRVRNTTLCILPQTVAEFWNVCTRPASARGGYGLTVSQTDARVRVLERTFTVFTDTQAIYSEWRDLVVSAAVSGVQVHDSRIAAAMRVHGIGTILTFNPSDFQRYPGVTAVHPDAV